MTLSSILGLDFGSDWFASAPKTTVDVLLLLLGRLEDLYGVLVSRLASRGYAREKTNLERAQEALVNAHHGTGVVKLSAVVGRAEEGHQLALGEELVSVFDDLVGTADEVHVVLLQESRHDVGTKREGDAAIVFAPPRDVLVRVRPEQVAQQAAVGNLNSSQHKFLPFASRALKAKLLTSVGRMTRRICSMELRSGLRPPCMVKIFSSMIAAMGRQLKQSVKVFQSLML